MSGRLGIAAALLLAACLAPRQPAEPRYFSPGFAPSASAANGNAVSISASAPELRLRRVTAADYLRRRIVWRRGVEVGFYDLLRWTQPPASYVEARLAHELFEKRGLRRATRPDAPSLTVELLTFDDVLEPAHEGVVALAVRLADASQQALLDRTFITRRPVAGDTPDAVARALGEALDEAIDQAGAAAASALGEAPR
ncbi:MAG: ABC-type transport auxiliary lipoprotein family protein [Myxococcota bacterium]